MDKLTEIVDQLDGELKQLVLDLIDALKKSITENQQLREKIKLLEHDNSLLKKKSYGSSSEKGKPEESDNPEDRLFNESEANAEEEPDDSPDETNKKDQKKPKREPLPEHLPRKVVEHDLSEADKVCPCCGETMNCIGDKISEELEYQPATLRVIQNRRKQYACNGCHHQVDTASPSKKTTVQFDEQAESDSTQGGETASQDSTPNDSNVASDTPAAPTGKPVVRTASKPDKLIPKSFATPSLLAAIVTSKFVDGLPLYRLARIFQRDSISLSRQTMSDWMLKLSTATVPLINVLQDHILGYDVAFADETTIQVLKEPGKKAQTKSYMWLFLGGPKGKRAMVYQYHPSRSGKVADDFFEGYTGALHCDGYAGYNKLITSEDIIGVNCWAHVRRKFIDALPNGKEKGVSGHVVKRIRELYRVESTLRDNKANDEIIKATRLEKSKPIIEKLKITLDEKIEGVPRESPVAKAIQYTLNRFEFLTTYLNDGRLEVDNNRPERGMRSFALGRNAWLFANTPKGAHSSARLYSLVESAKANSVEPRAYLEYIFKAMPQCQTVEDYEALMPWNLIDKLPYYHIASP